VAELTIVAWEDLLLLDAAAAGSLFLLVLMLILSTECGDDDDDDGGSGIVESMVFISLASDEDDIIGFTSHSALVSRNLGRRREFLFG